MCNVLKTAGVSLGKQLLNQKQCPIFAVPVAGVKNYKEPIVPDLEIPANRKLAIMPRTPDYGQMKPPKMMKHLHLMRGPEPVHNQLLHKQYGIRSVTGGRLRFETLEAIRMTMNKRMDDKRMFAIWRVNPPWQSVSKKGIGKRMGGGKGAVHHFVTPIKPGRIILELAGELDFIKEAKPILNALNVRLPFKSEIVTQEMLEKEVIEKERLEKENINPYTFKYVLLNNLGGCSRWASPYDYKWFGEYR